MRDYSDDWPDFSSLFADADMPINLPPLTQQLIKGLEQARTEQLAALSKVLNIAVGNQVVASVEKVEPITPQQRKELLKRTAEALLQLNRSPATPAVKAQIARLLEQQQLLGSEQLKWVHLQVNNRPLLTYTDKPLLPGQHITVQLTDAQRLALVDFSRAPAPAMPVPPAMATTGNTLAQPGPDSGAEGIRAALVARLLAGLPANLANATPASAPVIDEALAAGTGSKLSSETLNTLAEALRNLLPQKDQPQQLYVALQELQQIPVSRRQALLSSTVQQALKTLADQLRSPQQLSNPKLLQMIVKNSGVFLERKLASQLPAGSNVKPGAPLPVDSTLTSRLTNQDLKGALLQLLNRINQELPATARTTTPARPAHPVSQASVELPQLPPAMSLPRLLQLLQLPPRPEGELSDKVLRTQLLMLLQQYTLGSLAKIQLQQVHSLNHQQNQPDAAQPAQSWVFDIPVKHGQDVHHLELRIEQDRVDENASENEGNEKKIRQWSVTLSFDLPDAGGFYAQLTVVNDTVSAKLWAEQQDTLHEARLKLDNLREQLAAQGVVVKHLQCVQGKPPSTNISLHYSLVDITT